MQFDTYHVFTVDEHTIEAIGVLEQLARGELSEIAPVASELIGQRAVAPRAATWRRCCTTSPRGAAATIRSSARASRRRSARGSA